MDNRKLRMGGSGMEKAIHKLFIKQIKFVLFFIMNWPYPTDILFIVPREKMVGSTPGSLAEIFIDLLFKKRGRRRVFYFA